MAEGERVFALEPDWRGAVLLGDGAVMINVGGNVDALILYAPTERAELEVQIESMLDPSFQTHVYVLPRQIPNGVVYAAVFPALLAGEYLDCEPDGSEGEAVHLEGGEVSEGHWNPMDS